MLLLKSKCNIVFNLNIWKKMKNSMTVLQRMKNITEWSLEESIVLFYWVCYIILYH